MTTKTPQTPTNTRVPAGLLRYSVPAQPWQLKSPAPMLRVVGMSPSHPSRRQFLIGAGSLLILAPYGCGSDGESGQGGETTSSGSRTIEHKYGNTEVRGVPKRVVTVGYNDQDPVLAMGFTPVGVRDWFGDQPNAVWPWAQDELGDADPAILPAGDLNFERIAALKPDLIVGVFSGMTEDEYGTLSEIAPTIAQPGRYVDYGVPWQQQTRTIGRALGRQERAKELISEVEARFGAAREEHPGFEDATGVVALLDEGGTYNAYGLEDLRGRFMAALGFE